MIEKAFDHNADGAGIAYRKTNKDGEDVVYWNKGLGVNEIVEACAEAPLPFIAHFRIASIGGVSPLLTHPFPINRNGSLALEGETKGYVLFHNGHWKEWNDYCLRATNARDVDGKLIQVPMGRWSDTRAMAWLCAIHGPGFMNFLPEQKGIIFGPKDMQIFDGNGWDKIELGGKDEFVWCSNSFFMKGQKVSGQQMIHQPGRHTTYPPHVHGQTPGRGAGANGRFCRYGIGKDCCINQTLDDDGYCFMHPNGVPRMRLQDRVASGMSNMTVMGPAKNTLTGGSVVPPSPFVKQETRLPLELPPGEVISVELAEYLYKENQLSHNKLKRIKGLWEKATKPGTKSARRAEQALRQMSISIINSSTRSIGFVH